MMCGGCSWGVQGCGAEGFGRGLRKTRRRKRGNETEKGGFERKEMNQVVKATEGPKFHKKEGG